MITCYINPECRYCICRLCGQASCPHRTRNIKRCNLCWRNHDYRPILDCKNFYFKGYPKYKIVRVLKSPQVRYVDKTNADDIRVMLTEILELLRSGSSNSPITDVNCVRHNCLCLNCRYFSDCDKRCNLCTNYRGEHPVKLCAHKLLRDKSI